MGRISDGMNQVNSFIRTVLAMVVVGAVAAAGFFGWHKYNENDLAFSQVSSDLKKTKEELDQANDLLVKANVEIEQLNVEVEKLETARRLLKMDSRVARLRVLDKKADDAGVIHTTLEFVELDDQNLEIGKPKRITIEGEEIYVDYWVVQFDDKYVEEADIDRGTSIALFRRIFSEKRKPEDGFLLDEPNSLPAKYAQGRVPSEFEQKIWNDFWTIAHDEKAAAAMGIRAMHDQAVAYKVETGRTYLVNLRASAGLTVVPEPGPIDAAVDED